MEARGPDLWLPHSSNSDESLSEPPSKNAGPIPHTVPPSPRSREESLRSNLTWSASLHVGLALVILLKSLVFPGSPPEYRPALRVDLVGLPDILKKDLKDISPALPAVESPTETETAETEESKPVISKKTETSDQAEPDEMILHKRKESLTQKNRQKLKEFLKEQEKQKDRERKLKSAIARMKSLARIRGQISEQADQKESGVLIKGNKVSKGFSLSGDATEQAEISYYDLVKNKLQEVWELPVWLSRQNLSAKVEIFVDNKGVVRNMRFTKASGNAQFDEAIRRTIAQAQPFPRPPKEVEDSLLVHGISLGFPL